jgi:hypothetical protein
MPSDETRRLLRMFGVAVTEFEDAIESKAAAEELRKRAADAADRLAEVAALVNGLRSKIDTA